LGGAGWLLAAVSLLLATGAWAGSPLVPTHYRPTPTTVTNPLPWSPNGPLTVDQAVRRALACDGRIASLKAAAEIARQQRLAAMDVKDPVLEGESRTLGYAQSVSSDDFDTARFAVGVALPNPWLTIPRVNARTADYQAAQADLNAAIWQVRCDVRRLFAELDYLTNDLVLSANRVRLNGEILSAVQSRVSQGASTAAELMTAGRQSLQFQDDLDKTFHQYQLARRQLAALLDVAPESFDLVTNAVTPPLLPEPALSFQSAEAMADRARNDLAALRWRAQAAQSAYHEVRNEAVPWLKEIKAGYADDIGDYSSRYWAGVTMNVPIFTWTINHAAHAARAKADLASVDETNGVRLVRQELHDALDEMDQTRRQTTRNDLSVKPLIATMRQTLEALKNTPNIMPEQVAAAELQLVETLRYDLDTRWQYQLALLTLEQTLGVPLDQQPN
jgi:outer membrane protein TolC